VDLSYLVAAAEAQLDFFTRAIRFIDGASDALLRDCVHDYCSFLMQAGNAGSATRDAVPTFEVEVVWRAHLLSPVSYTQDCAAILGGNYSPRAVDHCPRSAGIYSTSAATTELFRAPPRVVRGRCTSVAWTAKLMATVRRQRHFMDKIVQMRKLGAMCTEQLAEEVGRYRAFLVEAATCGEKAEIDVPSLELDLVWHTHMLYPVRYAAECVELTGRLINHDDDQH
jgi:hypothetical protein